MGKPRGLKKGLKITGIVFLSTLTILLLLLWRPKIEPWVGLILLLTIPYISLNGIFFFVGGPRELFAKSQYWRITGWPCLGLLILTVILGILLGAQDWLNRLFPGRLPPDYFAD